MKTIYLAGGCFWGMEAYFAKLKGILSTAVGYIDGPTPNPTYRDVCQDSGHAEAVFLTYDETVLPLPLLLSHFGRIVDLTQVNRQGHDVGIQYRNGVYFTDPADEPDIRAFLAERRKALGKPLSTVVKPAPAFWPAEEYHQAYLDKNPGGYCHVNLGLLRPEERKQ